MTESTRDGDGSPQGPIADFIAVQLGTATPEQSQRVLDSLHDSNSELYQRLSQVEKWAVRTFGMRPVETKRLASDRLVPAPGQLLGRLFQFLDDQQRVGAISNSDVAAVVEVGLSHGVSRDVQMSMSSPRLQMNAAVAMIEKIIQRCPTLIAGLSGLDNTRSR